MKNVKTTIVHGWLQEDADIRDVQYFLRRVREGTILHIALSLIERAPTQDNIRNCLKKAILLMGERPDDWDLRALTARLERVFSLPEASLFFPSEPGVEVHAEREIASEEGVVKPDRVVVYPERAIVVDFKISRPNRQRLEEYVKQVRKYVDVVSSVFGKDTQGYLLFLYDAQVERVV